MQCHIYIYHQFWTIIKHQYIWNASSKRADFLNFHNTRSYNICYYKTQQLVIETMTDFFPFSFFNFGEHLEN